MTISRLTDDTLAELAKVRSQAQEAFLRAANPSGPISPERAVAWLSQIPEPKPYSDTLRNAINWALAHRWFYSDITQMMGLEPTRANVDAVRHAQRRRNQLAEQGR